MLFTSNIQLCCFHVTRPLKKIQSKLFFATNPSERNLMAAILLLYWYHLKGKNQKEEKKNVTKWPKNKLKQLPEIIAKESTEHDTIFKPLEHHLGKFC